MSACLRLQPEAALRGGNRAGTGFRFSICYENDQINYTGTGSYVGLGRFGFRGSIVRSKGENDQNLWLPEDRKNHRQNYGQDMGQ